MSLVLGGTPIAQVAAGIGTDCPTAKRVMVGTGTDCVEAWTAKKPVAYVESTSVTINGTNRVEWTHTSTVEGQIVVAAGGDQTGALVSTLTCDGVPLTPVSSFQGRDSRTDLYSLAGVPAGAHAMSITFSRNTGGSIISATYTGVGADRGIGSGGTSAAGVMEAGAVTVGEKEVSVTAFVTYSQAGGNVQVGTLRHAHDVSSSWRNGYHMILVDSAGPGTFAHRAVMTNTGSNSWSAASGRLF